MVKKLLLFLLCFGAALGGIYVWLHFPRGASLSDNIVVTFVNIQCSTIVDVVSATGILEPFNLSLRRRK